MRIDILPTEQITRSQAYAQHLNSILSERKQLKGRFRAINPDIDSKFTAMSSSRNNATVVVWESTDESRPVPVIFKRIKRLGLENELKINQAIKQRANGKLETFDIFMLFDDPADSKYAYIGTHMVHDLLPLSEYSVNSRYQATQLMLTGVQILQTLYECSIDHQDAFPKNMGLRLSTGALVSFDFELAYLVEEDDEELTHEYRYVQFKNLLQQFVFEIYEDNNNDLTLEQLEDLKEEVIARIPVTGKSFR